MLFVLGLADRHLLSVSALPSQAIYNLLFHVPLRMYITHTHAKKRAKVLLFFDMTKFLSNFFIKKCIFLHMCNFCSTFVPEKMLQLC